MLNNACSLRSAASADNGQAHGGVGGADGEPARVPISAAAAGHEATVAAAAHVASSSSFPPPPTEVQKLMTEKSEVPATLSAEPLALKNANQRLKQELENIKQKELQQEELVEKMKIEMNGKDSEIVRLRREVYGVEVHDVECNRATCVLSSQTLCPQCRQVVTARVPLFGALSNVSTALLAPSL